MNLDEKFTHQARNLATVNAPMTAGTITWRSPANVAIVKYWGKKDFQLPQNPSLSFSLEKSFTETRLDYKYRGTREVSPDFYFEGLHKPEFASRIARYLTNLSTYLPFIQTLELTIHSENSFPHSSGIASSASSMSSIALSLTSLERALFGTLEKDADFFTKASFLSRLGSGSASRSVYGGWSVWGRNSLIKSSTDEAAVPFGGKIHPIFQTLGDAILIVDSQNKKVSSSMGHRTMEQHPYAAARYKKANENLKLLIDALINGDARTFIHVSENEALSLHALMLSADEGYTLLLDRTWKIIESIKKYRQSSGLFMAFTLDAGPNVHFLYQNKDRKKVISFIQNELLKFCEEGKWIDDGIGKGPERIT